MFDKYGRSRLHFEEGIVLCEPEYPAYDYTTTHRTSPPPSVQIKETFGREEDCKGFVEHVSHCEECYNKLRVMKKERRSERANRDELIILLLVMFLFIYLLRS